MMLWGGGWSIYPRGSNKEQLWEQKGGEAGSECRDAAKDTTSRIKLLPLNVVYLGSFLFCLTLK